MFVVPALVACASAAAAAAPAPAAGSAFAAATVGGTPTIPTTHEPPGVTTGPVPRVPTTTVSLADRVIGLPSSAVCVRHLRVGLARPHGVHLHALSIRLGRRHIARKPVPKSITFHVLPAGHFALRVTVTTTSGRHLSRSRSYRRCG